MSDWSREYLDYHGPAPRREDDEPRPPAFQRAGVTIWPLAKIVRPERISFGSPVIIDDFVFLDGGAGTVIGSHVHIAVGAVLCGGGGLEIGDFANVASGARIYTGTDDVIGGLVGPTIQSEFRSVTRARTGIGRHCQVLANAVIHAGVTLPEGVVVAPGSVVTKRAAEAMGEWNVYGGAPATMLLGVRPMATVLAAESRLRESAR